MDADQKRKVRQAVLAGRALRALDEGTAEGEDDVMPSLWVASGDGPQVELPPAAATLLREALADLADGREVTVAPADLGIGTTEASRILGVSRTWLIRLIDDGELPCDLVGTKRRIPLGALIARRRTKSAELQAAARALSDAQMDAVERDLDVEVSRPVRPASGRPRRKPAKASSAAERAT